MQLGFEGSRESVATTATVTLSPVTQILPLADGDYENQYGEVAPYSETLYFQGPLPALGTDWPSPDNRVEFSISSPPSLAGQAIRSNLFTCRQRKVNGAYQRQLRYLQARCRCPFPITQHRHLSNVAQRSATIPKIDNYDLFATRTSLSLTPA